MPDNICPTYAAGTVSLVRRVLNDCATSTAASSSTGYFVKNPFFGTVGSFNNAWNNECLTQTVSPTFSSSGLNSFGRTGQQS